MNNFESAQGVVVKEVFNDPTRYIVVWTKKFGFVFAQMNDIVPEARFEIAPAVWVHLEVATRSMNNGPEGIKYQGVQVNIPAKDETENPATDEFDGRRVVNMHQYVSVKYFEATDKGIMFKTSVSLQHDNFAHEEYIGKVKIDLSNLNELRRYNVMRFDVVLGLDYNPNSGNPIAWRIVHYVYEGRQYSIQGFLSKQGKVLRGTGGRMMPRNMVRIPEDSMRLVNKGPGVAHAWQQMSMQANKGNSGGDTDFNKNKSGF